MFTIGVLSDTHLSGPDERFRQAARRCFTGVDMVLHAGDLVDLSVLTALEDWEVAAVHGNMCTAEARQALPSSTIITVGEFRIALTHGAGYGFQPEARLLTEFAEADCIVFGHTHRPCCLQMGNVLLVNPGSFRGTGRYGAAGTCALITLDDRPSARLLQVTG